VKILLAASEVVPYAKTGGLADVAGALPGQFSALGHDVRLIMPRYQEVRQPLTLLKSDLSVELGGERISFDLFEDSSQGYTAWFVDCPRFFDREGLYQLDGEDHPDNAARFIFFSKAILAVAEAMEFPPDIIHAHDWQTALVPLLLKRGEYPFFAKTVTVLTIHNLAYMGNFPPRVALPLIGLGAGIFTAEGIEYYGKANLLKAGLIAADLLTTVSRRYAEEILSHEFGYGLEGVLTKRRSDLHGVLNGIDYVLWNPATDEELPANFSAENLTGKTLCKKELQREFGLPERSDLPLFGIVTRLADQKGLDIFAKAAERFFAKELQFVLLGTGQAKYHRLFGELRERHPTKCAVALKYDSSVAQRIYAGSDLFLMPSRYEPCGLGQLIALAYGTIPLVRATGGLADTITEGENGFSFTDYTAEELLKTVERALKAFNNSEIWSNLQRNAFGSDFSWTVSAKRYLELFEKAIAGWG